MALRATCTVITIAHRLSTVRDVRQLRHHSLDPFLTLHWIFPAPRGVICLVTMIHRMLTMIHPSMTRSCMTHPCAFPYAAREAPETAAFATPSVMGIC